ncbi:uncharacterized protein LOC135125359 [Zophobas morio]|uniref:uncharacterized protein LOC135125359 n=1 Tax=Zophobas morio TaxID=2755281 RepID=UPI0030827C9C
MGNSSWCRGEKKTTKNPSRDPSKGRFPPIGPWSPFRTLKNSFPLHSACEKGDLELICKLLYHGVDPNAPNSDGLLPIELLPCDENSDVALDILFPYSVEDGCSVSLHTMTVAMLQTSSYFRHLCSVAKEVTYDDTDLIFFRNKFRYLVKKHFFLFLDKFEHVVRAAIDEFFLYWMIIWPAGWDDVGEYAAVLDALVARGCLEELARPKTHLATEPKRIYEDEIWVAVPGTDIIIAQLIELFSFRFDEDEITKMILEMVSYGLRVTFHDLDFVYGRYGHNDLFRILLHMDVDDNVHWKNEVSVMVVLHFDPGLCLQDPEFIMLFEPSVSSSDLNLISVRANKDKALKYREFWACLEMQTRVREEDSCSTTGTDGIKKPKPVFYSLYYERDYRTGPKISLDAFFDYFNHEKVKEFCLSRCRRKKLIEKVKRMPTVSSLVELSRNVARSYIVDKFRAWSSRKFLTAVNALPVDNTTKSVLALDTKIY